MKLDNHAAKQAYVQLLIDASRKKTEVLKRLMEITKEQEDLMGSEDFDDERFLHTISLKEEQLKDLDELDRGFDQIFDNIKQELTDHKYRYEPEIKALQGYITTITDMSVQLQAMELRNKTKLEALLVCKRKEIRKSKISSQAAVKYYKTMTSQNEGQSYFYDKKK